MGNANLNFKEHDLAKLLPAIILSVVMLGTIGCSSKPDNAAEAPHSMPAGPVASGWYSSGAALEVQVTSRKRNYTVGESPAFEVTAKNTSSEAVRLLFFTHAIFFVDDVAYVYEMIPWETVQPTLNPGETRGVGSVTLLAPSAGQNRLIRVKNIHESIEMNAQNLGEALILTQGEHRMRISCSPIETKDFSFSVGTEKE